MTTLLIVDDDPAVLLNTSAYLEDEDYDVLEAGNGLDALELVMHHKPALGIVDMRLPGIDGNEFIIKAHELHPQMKFIIHTGSSDYVIPKQLMNLGIDKSQIVQKPVPDMDIFVQVINKLLVS